MPGLIFVDKTLVYALNQKKIDAASYLQLKRKISRISGGTIFDVPFELAAELKRCDDNALNDVRLRIAQDVRQVKAAAGLGVKGLRVSIGRDVPADVPASLGKVLEEAARLNLEVSAGCVDLSESAAESAANQILFFQRLTESYPLRMS